MGNLKTRYGHDRKLCFIRLLLCCPFYLLLVLPFLPNCSRRVSLFNCPRFQVVLPCSNLRRLGERCSSAFYSSHSVCWRLLCMWTTQIYITVCMYVCVCLNVNTYLEIDCEKLQVVSILYIYIYHHHHIALVARISLTLSRHSSLSFIALGRSSGQQPVSSHSCWMYVRAGRPAFARPWVGIHKSTSLMSSSLLLQQCPACLVRLTWIVFVIGGRWPYSWCLVGWCCQDLFRIARSILV